jgi:hypothetical protein
MNTIIVTFSFLAVHFFAQSQKSTDATYDLTLGYKPATIKILTDTGFMRLCVVNNLQKITYTDIKAGHYKIEISGQGQATRVKDSIIVSEGQNLVLRFKVDGPCLYYHPSDYIPTCPKNHRDSIIPIFYGLIVSAGNTVTKDKKEWKAKYAGCVITGCDPRFYCKEHDIEF